MATTKFDPKREIASYTARRGRFDLVEVPPLRYAMVDGRGDPNTAPEYAAAVEALYAVSYAAKFALKRELDRDHVVGPLEGLWGADDPATFVSREKSAWSWTMMIWQPDWLELERFEAAVAEAAAKAPAASRVRLETLDEGLSVQTLHIGSYDDEGPTLARLHDEFMPGHGLRFNGLHHEVYLGDPRRTAPEKLRTILRQPVARAT
ncbi:GyrI-like domain-containing protein [Agromyces sp. H3Y2-19a]|uniref:GyrI-like domain-containing protein n=1 Tax=Agromyces TaxID=33877 RepID=UPI001E620FE5|nr:MULTISPECIES: GyrI-like domain-containing protein [Agromyces]MCD5346089.1 GyrI-like domain-containing protein [Agromyces sp. S2-1-8]MDF0512451.1 GyrI-like domain-containing protein [Agromyces chromiiresistens]